jgi:3-hydroxymyristoyl/3-hydroxydecanoyl-(acyl carrier protein) dehydratase
VAIPRYWRLVESIPLNSQSKRAWAQLDWVMAYGEELAPGMRFSAIDSVKFQRPVLPESRLELTVRWDSARSLLSFAYVQLKDEARLPVSSGKIKLCP